MNESWNLSRDRKPIYGQYVWVWCMERQKEVLIHYGETPDEAELSSLIEGRYPIWRRVGTR